MLKPIVDSSAFLAKGCAVYGNVTLKSNVSVWYNATIRAMEESIVIETGTNVQDNAVIHVDCGYQVNIGANVTIGHGAIIHGCNIGDNTLVGMGAIILNGASVGNNCIVGAGALITQNTVIPDNCLVLGSPAKVIRQITQQEIAANIANAELYVKEIDFFRECERME